jgi:hypothetical protein
VDTRDVLGGVRLLIENGWTRGRDKKKRGARTCYCLSGALAAVVGEDWDSDLGARTYLKRAISPFSPGHVIITEWNDAPGRTKAQVLAVIDGAIKLAEVLFKKTIVGDEKPKGSAE